jgi:hypothetical protein
MVDTCGLYTHGRNCVCLRIVCEVQVLGDQFTCIAHFEQDGVRTKIAMEFPEAVYEDDTTESFFKCSIKTCKLTSSVITAVPESLCECGTPARVEKWTGKQ